MTKENPTLRRPKQSPCEDFWHTMRLGLVVFVILLIVLPWLFSALQ